MLFQKQYVLTVHRVKRLIANVITIMELCNTQVNVNISYYQINAKRDPPSHTTQPKLKFGLT